MIDPMLERLLMILIGAGVAFGLTRFGVSRDRKTQKVLTAEGVAIEAVKTRDARIQQLEKDVQLLQSQAEAAHKAAIPITAAMEAMLIAKLVNDHLPDADALLKKQADHTLTPEDAIAFAEALKERETDEDPRIGEAQQISAKILPDVIRLRVLAEEAAKEGPLEVKTVMVTVPATDTIQTREGGTQEREKEPR